MPTMTVTILHTDGKDFFTPTVGKIAHDIYKVWRRQFGEKKAKMLLEGLGAACDGIAYVDPLLKGA